jgi:hypothetical protein
LDIHPVEREEQVDKEWRRRKMRKQDKKKTNIKKKKYIE